jgi:hypothetical protein
MPHPKHTPSILLSYFQAIFADVLVPGFVENNDDATVGRVRFTRDYPEKNMRVVVTAPIKRFKSGTLSPVSYEFTPGMRIFFTIHHSDNKHHFAFRNSRVNNTGAWIEVTTKKVLTLVALIDGIKMCSGSECTGLYPFPVVDTAPQGKPESTRFVWCKCLKCHRKEETAYGTGLKTAISQYLPKR